MTVAEIRPWGQRAEMAERGFLASCILDLPGSRATLDTLTESHFWLHKHRALFALLKNFPAPEPSLAALFCALEPNDLFGDELAGWLCDLIDGVWTSVNREHFASVLREEFVRRKALEVLGDAGDDVELDVVGEELDDRLRKLAVKFTGIADLLDEVGGIRTVTESHDIMKSMLEEFDAQDGKHVKSGLVDLDRKLGGGFFGTDLVIVGGATSMGKTTFVSNLIGNFLNHQVPTVVVSREASDAQLMGLVTQTMVGSKLAFYECKAHDDVRKYVSAFAKISEEGCLFSVNRDTVAGIETDVAPLADRGVRIVVVDYLQLLKDPSAERRHQEVGNVARDLKNLAKNLGVTVIATAQVARDIGKRDDHRPRLSDLRESGDIENAADVVLMVYRESYYAKTEAESWSSENKAEIGVLKNRNRGDTGWVTVFHDPKTRRYGNFQAYDGQF